MPTLIGYRRVVNQTVERITDAPVPMNQTVELTTNVPVPMPKKKPVETPKVIPRERVGTRPIGTVICPAGQTRKKHMSVRMLLQKIIPA